MIKHLIVILSQNLWVAMQICFGEAAATLWKNLPVNIRKYKTLDAFKKKVKTNLEVLIPSSGQTFILLSFVHLFKGSEASIKDS